MPAPRLDVWLVERGHFSSRQQAQRAIQAGEIQINGHVIDKPGTPMSGEPEVLVKARPPYVSRGGEKLAGALATFPVAVAGRICLDGGISTGGFTDCLLQQGAHQIYGVDVGYGQVAWSLQTDERVIIRERTNLRYLTPTELYGDRPPSQYPDLAVVDVSFISLTKVLPALWSLLQAPREALLLVKPQFEAGREAVGKKGVVKHPPTQAAAIAKVTTAAQELGWLPWGLTWSPAPGPAGNIEYWLWLQAGRNLSPPPLPDPLAIAQQARQVLFPSSS